MFDDVPFLLAFTGGLVATVYAAGMALPLLAISVTLALGRDTLLRRARTLGRHTNRLAGGLLVLARAYIILFWTVDLTGVTGGPTASVILLVERASARLTNLIGERPTLWGAVFATVVVLSAAAARRARQRARRPGHAPEQPSGVAPD